MTAAAVYPPRPAMTALQAKANVIHMAVLQSLTYSKITARTVDFADLARQSAVVVSVRGIKGTDDWSSIKNAIKGTNVRINLPLVLMPASGLG